MGGGPEKCGSNISAVEEVNLVDVDAELINVLFDFLSERTLKTHLMVGIYLCDTFLFPKPPCADPTHTLKSFMQSRLVISPDYFNT